MNILQIVLYEYATLGYITYDSSPEMYSHIIELWLEDDTITIKFYEPENGMAFVLTKNKQHLLDYIPENRR